MDININHIVSAEELSISSSIIEERLDDMSEMIVFEDNRPRFVILSLDRYNGFSKPTDQYNDCSTSCQEKIGKYVQDNMRRLFTKNILTESDLSFLTSEEYSSSNFGLSYPVIKKYNPDLPFDQQKRDSKGYNRYYNFTLTSSNGEYFLCSQWVEPLHREKFETWLARFSDNK